MTQDNTELLPCPRCCDAPTWGYLSFPNGHGGMIRHNAIRCLRCHYWFYVDGEKTSTAEIWNTRPTQGQGALAAKAEAAPDDGLMADFHDCQRCWKEAGADPFNHIMFLCPICGNKRCPKATDHRLACTGSNEPGQEGSSYTKGGDA